MFHAKVLLDKVHSLGALNIFESVGVVAIQAFHNVLLEMFQKINLALQVFRILIDVIALARVCSTAVTRSDVVKVARENR